MSKIGRAAPGSRIGSFTEDFLQLWVFLVTSYTWFQTGFKMITRSISQSHLNPNSPLAFVPSSSQSYPPEFLQPKFFFVFICPLSLCSLVQAHFASHLDYCNSFLAGL